MNCKDIKVHITEYLLGELDSRSGGAVRTHVAGCDACRLELEAIDAAWTRLGVLPDEEPGESLRRNFYSMLESYTADLEPDRGRRNFAPIRGLSDWLRRVRRPVPGWAVSLLILLTGLLGGYLLSSLPVKQETRRDLPSLLQRENHRLKQQLAISLMEQSSPSQRLEGIARTSAVEEPGTEVPQTLLHTLNHDPNDNVRLSAVDALYLFAHRPRVKQGIVDSLSKQSSPLVQIAIMDLLAELREKRAVNALKQLLEKNKLNPAVKQRAQWCLDELI